MAKQQVNALFKRYVLIAENAVIQGKVTEEMRELELELRAAIDGLIDPLLGSQASSKAAAVRRDAQRFTLEWGGGGAEIVQGFATLSEKLNMRENSITSYLSKGRGRFFLHRYSKELGGTDILTVTRVDDEGNRIERPRGGEAQTIRRRAFRGAR